jgi:hypothetical protein
MSVPDDEWLPAGWLEGAPRTSRESFGDVPERPRTGPGIDMAGRGVGRSPSTVGAFASAGRLGSGRRSTSASATTASVGTARRIASESRCPILPLAGARCARRWPA